MYIFRSTMKSWLKLMPGYEFLVKVHDKKFLFQVVSS